MDCRKVAEELVQALGGKDNIDAAAHCATRLRFALLDEKKIDKGKLDSMAAIQGTFSTGGQFQIILGAGIVNKVYRHLASITGISEMTTRDVQRAGAKKLNPVQQFVKMLSDIFVPIVPAIVAGGLLMGINNLLTAPDLLIKGKSFVEANPGIANLADMINTFAYAAFVFLPILIGFSAMKRYGGNPFLGAFLGMIMVHPGLLSAWEYGDALTKGEIPVWDFWGVKVEKVGYQGTVLPILAATYMMAKTELFLRKVVPSVLDNLLTPLLSILFTGILTFTLVGPITRSAGNFLTIGLTWLYDTTGVIGGGLLGLTYAPFVITGMQHSFIAVETQLLADMARTGGSFIFPIATMSNIAQGAAAFAVFIVTRNPKIKGVASAAGVSSVLGISEPAMFGVNLKLRYPFVAAIIGSAVGSVFITFYKIKSVALGAAGLTGIISIRPDRLLPFIIGMAVSFTVSFLLTMIFSRREVNKEQS